MKKIALILIAAMACVSSCTKNNLPQPDTKKIDKGVISSSYNILTIPPNTYVAGYYHAASGHTVAAYWVNNTMTRLVTDSSVNSQARALFVSGRDVYVVGFVNSPSGVAKAACWKNGVQLLLDNGTASDAFGVTLVGTDIYVAGYHNYGRSTVPHAVYWKNGVATYLNTTTSTSEASAITANGTDVYISGFITPSSNYYTRAAIWKNGIAAILGDTTTRTWPTGICVSSNIIYMAGNYGGMSGPDPFAVTWTNGIMSYLPVYPDALAYTNHIVVNGRARYIVGYEFATYPPFISRSVYWNGNTEIVIPAVHINDEENSGGISYYSGVLYYASNWSSDGTIWVNQQVYQTVSHKGIINDLFVN